MAKTKIHRRTVLRGMLGGAAVSVSLPLLDVFLNDNGDAMADGSALPARFGVWFWGNGNHPYRWTPQTEGPDWELTEQLMPFASVKEFITVVSGMAVKTGNPEAHLSGAAGMLSGTPLIIEPGNKTFGAASIDQVIADGIGNETLFKSLETGVDVGSDGTSTWSYKGPNLRNPAEVEPKRLFDRLFGPSFQEPGDMPMVDPTIRLRRSVLDAVMTNSNQLRTRLGTRDRQRLDQHFESIRALERRLQRLEEDPPNLAACTQAPEPAESYPDIEGRPQLKEKSEAMADIVAMALACDQTRVFSHWFTRSVANSLFPGVPQEHHTLTHDEPGDQPFVNEIVLQIMEVASYWVNALASIEEGDGRLIDNSVMLITSDCSFGRQHLIEDYPILLAGAACGRLQMGTHYHSAAGENTSKVGLSLVRAMGIPAPSFGSENGQVTDGLGPIET